MMELSRNQFKLTFCLIVFLVRLELNGSPDSLRIEQDDNDNIVLKSTEWLVYLPRTVGHVVSLVLLKTSKLSNCIIFEARNENKAGLKMMEAKLREFLKGMNGT